MANRLPTTSSDGREKIIVAVHGIGDQTRCETIQQVARQFCKFYRLPDTIPLGHMFSQIVDSGSAAQPATGVFRHEGLPGLGFSEVYWASVPRILERKNYTLEDAKQWARTIVGRVAQRGTAGQEPPGLDADPPNVDLAEQVIGELIDAVDTIEKLCWLASTARMFQFGLKQMLMDYLGDVQVVTEFAGYRQRILEMMHTTLTQVRASNSGADIYIVAHSEGTVVSLLALLQSLQYAGSGLAGHEQYQWASQVRGLMTIGSPLDTHMLLWPELWSGMKPQRPKPAAGPIDWRNYFDYGDPIGERLKRTRQWLAASGWKPFFAFSEDHDHGFSRYVFPGKAHCDYWNDSVVFGHFIRSVVHPLAAPEPDGLAIEQSLSIAETMEARSMGNADGPHEQEEMHEVATTLSMIEPLSPPSRWLPELLSPALPFLFAAALLVAAVFLFYKGAAGLALPFRETAGDVLRNVAAVSLLLGGATVVTRIPRLTNHWSWRGSAVAGFLLTLICVPLLLSPGAKDCLGVTLEFMHGIPGAPLVLEWLDKQADAISAAAPKFALEGTTLGMIYATTIGVMFVGLIGCLRPRWGAKPLAVMGGCAVIGLFFARLGGERAYDWFAETQQMVQAEAQGAPPAVVDAVAIHCVNSWVAKPHREGQKYKQFAVAWMAKHRPGQQQPLGPASGSATTAGLAAAAPLAATAPLATAPLATQFPSLPPGETQPGSGLEIWPLFLTCSAFLYLWYCSMLIFDLSVVWHHYVRQSAMLDDLDNMHETEISEADAAEIDRLLLQSEQSAA